MIHYPELITCSINDLYIQKVSPEKINYIWETAPLEQLFLVTGAEASSSMELEEIMQLDWTTWFFMLDLDGYSYGLIHLVPEIDNTVSIHGIGWTQLNKSPRKFILSWYAIHYYLFNQGFNLIRSYCDSKNTNAIKFDFKTGYTYDYCMPSREKNSKVVHLKLDRETFDIQLKQKKVTFNLNVSFELAVKNNTLLPGKAISSISKGTTFHISSIESKKEISEITNNYNTDELFHYFYLIPQPKLFSISLTGKKVGFMIISKILSTKKIILFNLTDLEFTKYLELIEVIKSNFELIPDDIILVEDKINSYFLKDALSINFKFSGNHSSLSSMVWIV
jgi:hypothetical protein